MDLGSMGSTLAADSRLEDEQSCTPKRSNGLALSFVAAVFGGAVVVSHGLRKAFRSSRPRKTTENVIGVHHIHPALKALEEVAPAQPDGHLDVVHEEFDPYAIWDTSAPKQG